MVQDFVHQQYDEFPDDASANTTCSAVRYQPATESAGFSSCTTNHQLPTVFAEISKQKKHHFRPSCNMFVNNSCHSAGWKHYKDHSFNSHLTIWKVDRATPMYWFVMAPYPKPPFDTIWGWLAIYFHCGVSESWFDSSLKKENLGTNLNGHAC